MNVLQASSCECLRGVLRRPLSPSSRAPPSPTPHATARLPRCKHQTARNSGMQRAKVHAAAAACAVVCCAEAAAAVRQIFGIAGGAGARDLKQMRGVQPAPHVARPRSDQSARVEREGRCAAATMSLTLSVTCAVCGLSRWHDGHLCARRQCRSCCHTAAKARCLRRIVRMQMHSPSAVTMFRTHLLQPAQKAPAPWRWTTD